MAGGVIKSWSNRQGSVALSSAEAEFYAAGKAAVEALGARSLCADLGWGCTLQIRMDAEAARAIASRQGIGKVRHLEVRYLWLQDKVRRGEIKLVKVWGKENPADVLTEPMSFSDALGLLGSFHLKAALLCGWSDVRSDAGWIRGGVLEFSHTLLPPMLYMYI